MNEPLNDPVDTDVGLPTGVGELQVGSELELYPKVTGVPSDAARPEPFTLIVAPTGPDEGLLVTLAFATCACAGEAVLQPDTVNTSSTMKHSMSMVVIKTIFDKCSSSFIFAFPKELGQIASPTSRV